MDFLLLENPDGSMRSIAWHHHNRQFILPHVCINFVRLKMDIAEPTGSFVTIYIAWMIHLLRFRIQSKTRKMLSKKCCGREWSCIPPISELAKQDEKIVEKVEDVASSARTVSQLEKNEKQYFSKKSKKYSGSQIKFSNYLVRDRLQLRAVKISRFLPTKQWGRKSPRLPMPSR